MFINLSRHFLCASLCLLASWAAEPQRGKLDTTEVKALLSGLQASGHEQRLKAAAHLSEAFPELGQQALSQVAKSLFDSQDPELNQRLERLLFSAYVKDNFQHELGFLGIGMVETEFLGKRRVAVSWVEPNSPAQNSGIEAQDIILAIDDQEVSGLNATERVMALIALKEAGNQCKFLLFRKGEKLAITATLANRADFDLARRSNILRKFTEAELKLFFQQWLARQKTLYQKTPKAYQFSLKDERPKFFFNPEAARR